MNRSNVISRSLVECPLSSTRASRSFADLRYASACCFCSAAVGAGGTSDSCGGGATFWGVCAATGGAGVALETSSGATSSRISPSEVNRRRSVTVKLSCFFSAIDCPLRCLHVLAMEYFRKWQRRDRKLRVAHLKLLGRNRDLTPHITQRHGPVAGGKRQRSG